MRYSYRIANGRVVDPSAGTDGIRDVYIRNSKIVRFDDAEPAEIDETIDASGCLVTPGLIDFHTHLDRGHSAVGLHPDLMTLPSGVTAAVDAGSAGSGSFEGFYRDTAAASDITIKSYVNVSAAGMVTEQYFEDPNPDLYDIPQHEYLFERYRHNLLGLKVRVGKLFSKAFNLRPLTETKKLANRLGTAVCVHAVHPESPYSEICSVLDAGDVLCHCFQAKGDFTILDGNGRVTAAAREARSRGVTFDAASGRANYSFGVARKALDDGFPPDVISTDVVTYSIYKPKVFSLPYVMCGYLALGMPLVDVLRAVTATPARLMGMAGSIGTLEPGALADVAIFRLDKRPIVFRDQFGNSVDGDALLIPRMTIKAGRTAFMDIGFAFGGSSNV